MDDLTEKLKGVAPSDWREPEWEIPSRVHNWRNYATDDLRMIWHTFDDRQALVVACLLEEIASDEPLD